MGHGGAGGKGQQGARQSEKKEERNKRVACGVTHTSHMTSQDESKQIYYPRIGPHIGQNSIRDLFLYVDDQHVAHADPCQVQTQAEQGTNYSGACCEDANRCQVAVYACNVLRHEMNPT